MCTHLYSQISMSVFANNADQTLLYKRNGGVCAIDANGMAIPPAEPFLSLPDTHMHQAGVCFARRNGVDTLLFRAADGFGIDEVDVKTGAIIRRVGVECEWKVEKQDFLSPYVMDQSFTAQIACSADLIAVVDGYPGSVTLISYESGLLVKKFYLQELSDAAYHAYTRSVAFTSNGLHLVLADYGNGYVWKVSVADTAIVGRMKMPGLFIPRHVLVLPDDTIAVTCWGRLWCGTPPSRGGVVFIDKDFTACEVKFRAPHVENRPMGLAVFGNGTVSVILAGESVYHISPDMTWAHSSIGAWVSACCS